MDRSNLCCIIPGELVINIISRLPVKSLMKFRIVCKSWNALTRDTDFIAEHLKVSSSSSTATAATEEKVNLILLHGRFNNSLLVQSNTVFKENFPIKLPFKVLEGDCYRIQIFGPCNGIICVYRYKYCGNSDRYHAPSDDLAFFNPATKEIKKIPPSPRFRRDNWYNITFGFGYASTTNDYKLVKMTGESGKITVEVYSLNKNSWKLVEAKAMFYNFSEIPNLPVYSRGFCYWKGRNKDHKDVLISFDMTNEEFGEIELPKEVNDIYIASVSHEINVIETKGHLCFIWPTLEPCVFNSWAMVNRRWIKGKAIELPRDFYSFDYMWGHPISTPKYELVTVRRNGDIILRNKFDWLLKVYNIFTREVMPLRFDATSEAFNVVYCKETLISLQRG